MAKAKAKVKAEAVPMAKPMPKDFDYDVFLSHSSKDKAVVRPLAERLRADGLKVWFDDAPIKGSLAQFLYARQCRMLVEDPRTN